MREREGRVSEAIGCGNDDDVLDVENGKDSQESLTGVDRGLETLKGHSPWTRNGAWRIASTRFRRWSAQEMRRGRETGKRYIHIERVFVVRCKIIIHYWPPDLRLTPRDLGKNANVELFGKEAKGDEYIPLSVSRPACHSSTHS